MAKEGLNKNLEITETWTDAQWNAFLSSDLLGIGDTEPYKRLEMLRIRAKEEPERFKNLLCKQPKTIEPAFAGALLLGVSKSIDEQNFIEALRFCHNLPGRPLGKNIITTIKNRYFFNSVPEEIFNIVCWYACYAHKVLPTMYSSPKEIDGEDNYIYRDDFYYHIMEQGKKIFRGQCVLYMMQCACSDTRLWESINPYLDYLVDQDKSVCVRAVTISLLIRLFKTDEARAIDFFVRACKCDSDIFFAESVHEFIDIAEHHTKSLAPVLEKMLSVSDATGPMRIAAKVIAKTVSNETGLEALFNTAIHTTIDCRRELTIELCKNFSSCKRPEYIIDQLSKLSLDSDNSTRSSAISCIKNFTMNDWITHQSFISVLNAREGEERDRDWTAYSYITQNILHNIPNDPEYFHALNCAMNKNGVTDLNIKICEAIKETKNAAPDLFVKQNQFIDFLLKKREEPEFIKQDAERFKVSCLPSPYQTVETWSNKFANGRA
jgi:hypothetical protein